MPLYQLQQGLLAVDEGQLRQQVLLVLLLGEAVPPLLAPVLRTGVALIAPATGGGEGLGGGGAAYLVLVLFTLPAALFLRRLSFLARSCILWMLMRNMMALPRRTATPEK